MPLQIGHPEKLQEFQIKKMESRRWRERDGKPGGEDVMNQSR
jgi:hypothetical protein